ncbi:MAG: hypothetical protein EOO43_04900 [Flavobacterium sp.]|nr:MAG: hypothetical protein EOO43_04900 [Flavobacterium sp.]
MVSIKRLWLSSLIFIIHISCINTSDVYVCNSPNAQRYHLNVKCRGLSNCSYKTIKTTVQKAKKEGRTLCKWER